MTGDIKLLLWQNDQNLNSPPPSAIDCTFGNPLPLPRPSKTLLQPPPPPQPKIPPSLKKQ